MKGLTQDCLLNFCRLFYQSNLCADEEVSHLHNASPLNVDTYAIRMGRGLVLTTPTSIVYRVSAARIREADGACGVGRLERRDSAKVSRCLLKPADHSSNRRSFNNFEHTQIFASCSSDHSSVQLDPSPPLNCLTLLYYLFCLGSTLYGSTIKVFVSSRGELL